MYRKTLLFVAMGILGLCVFACQQADDIIPTGTSSPPNWDDHTQGLPFEFGYDAGLAKAKSEGKPAMMFVTTTWCGFCKKLAGEIEGWLRAASDDD